MRYIVLLFLLASQIALAQQKQMSLEDAILGAYTNLRPESVTGISWKNERTFTFAKNDTLWAESVKSGVKHVLTNRDEINQIIKTKIGFLRFPTYSWDSGHQFWRKSKNTF